MDSNINKMMEAAAQGDKNAVRFIEKKYGVDNGQDFAIDKLSEESPPPNLKSDDDYLSPEALDAQNTAKAKSLAADLILLENKKDREDVLMKIAGEDYRLAQKTGVEILGAGGGLIGASVGLSLGIPTQTLSVGLGGGSALSTPSALVGTMQAGPYAGGTKEQNEAHKKYSDIKLSPDAQKMYDEYKTKGYSSKLNY